MSAKLARIEEQERLLAEKMAQKLNSEKKRKDLPSEGVDETVKIKKKKKKTSHDNVE